MKLRCLYNNPETVPEGISGNFSHGLVLEKEYMVMGITLTTDGIQFLVDQDGRPSWFPEGIFELTDNSLPDSWFYNSRKGGVQHGNLPYLTSAMRIWGYKELVLDEEHYIDLFERVPAALDIYKLRKNEISA